MREALKKTAIVLVAASALLVGAAFVRTVASSFAFHAETEKPRP